jgi:hypothetical protein
MTNTQDLESKVTQSLDLFLTRDRYLLQHDVSERAITHKLADAFEGVFGSDGGYDVDCEYNRRVGLDPIKRANNGRRVYPDIVVHRRRQQNDNLLAVEVKKTKAGSKAIQKDEKRLKEDYVRGQLNYKYGLLVLFRVGTNPSYTCRLFDGEQWIDRMDANPVPQAQ